MVKAPRRVDGLGDQVDSAVIFRAGLSRLNHLVERLETRVKEIELENVALRRCLEDDGNLRPERFMARLHNQRFQTALRVHPCRFEVSLTDVLLSRDMRSCLGAFSGWSDIRHCSALCRATKELTSLIPHMLYMCGGFDGSQILATMQRLDPAGCALSDDRDYSRRRSQAQDEGGGSSLCCGGSRGSSADREDQPIPGLGMSTVGTWETMPAMAQSRAGFAATVYSGTLVVCGGFDGKHFLRSVERFRLSAASSSDDEFGGADGVGTWETMVPMSQRRHCAVAATLLGQLHVCGGYNGEEALRSIERFDPHACTWEVAAPMAHRRHGAAAATLRGNLYVCGGFDGEKPLNSIERFDPRLGIWETLSPMSQMRNMAFSVSLNSLIYVCGGCNGKETLNSAECYNPALDTWSVAEPMVQRRHGAAAAVILGQLFACGGGDSGKGEPGAAGVIRDDVERLSPALSTWRPATPMPNPRIDMVIVSMCTPI